ncbi:hypothetical protein [Aeromonas jandaei]|uniref:hypothetical protein n=1 Tax=Aeromonas jandaei TaxID=650 RepID=UPI001AC003CD|nr:hypothetical protein [Aeromonas jandaei]QSR71967.1 hypothetical protein GP488_05760 [Aeromonas jandaei]
MSVMRLYKISTWRQERVTLGIHIFLAVILLICAFFVAALQWEQHLLTQEVNMLAEKIEQQNLQQERVKRQEEKNSPEHRRILTMLQEHTSSEQRLYPLLLKAIENTWSSRLAILGLKLERSGKQVKLDIAVTDLEEAFLFVERLNAVNHQTIATLVRHSTRTVANQANTLVAHIEIERI